MTRTILWCRLRLIDIRTHNSIQISPSNHKSHSDAPLVHALGVIGDPDDGVGDAGVDAKGAEEGSGIAETRGGAGDEHAETYHAEDGDEDVTEAALAGAIGDIADCDGEDGGGGVGGDGKELGFRGGVAELLGD